MVRSEKCQETARYENTFFWRLWCETVLMVWCVFSRVDWTLDSLGTWHGVRGLRSGKERGARSQISRWCKLYRMEAERSCACMLNESSGLMRGRVEIPVVVSIWGRVRCRDVTVCMGNSPTSCSSMKRGFFFYGATHGI